MAVERQYLCAWDGNMRNPVTVLTALLSVEFVLYTMSLCSPQWLVLTQGASEGLFALCSAYDGLSSCMTFPAWLGEHPSYVMSSFVYGDHILWIYCDGEQWLLCKQLNRFNQLYCQVAGYVILHRNVQAGYIVLIIWKYSKFKYKLYHTYTYWMIFL